MKTRLIKNEISEAAGMIRSGGLVSVPTETVYGLAANGLDEVAVSRIYEVKGRPADKPIALMVAGYEDIDRYCRDVPEAAYRLAKKHWPGPLTIVLKAADCVPEIVRAGGETVALRCPDHPLTLELLRETGLPLAVPSANPSNLPSARTADEVLDYFDGRIDAVIDGGECGFGTESTIIDMSGTPYKILRYGALSVSELTAGLTVIGITGGTGCGKTTALNVLAEKGALIVDCDAVYHRLLVECAPMLDELREEFPGAFLSGAFDRKALGKIVFSDGERLLQLNEITHKYVDEAVDELLLNHALGGGTLAAIDAIALIESGISEHCKAVIGITAPTERRIARLMSREDVTEEYARLRIAAQKPNEYFEEICDLTIANDGTEKEFIDKCKKEFQDILKSTDRKGE